jgi:rfaE bifunctional protein kinase chain/domain
MTPSRLRDLLERIGSARVAVFGDFCLDMYWLLDPALSEVSIETGKRTSAVRRQYCSLGGAGNIVANLSDLGVAGVHAVGVIGDDLFGREMVELLKVRRADVSGMLTQRAEWITPAYCKPFVGDDEQGRVDFGVANVLAPATEEALLKTLAAILTRVDAVICNQQLPRGVNTGRILAGINRLVAEHPEKLFIVDSRDREEANRGVIYRVGAHEAMRLCGTPKPRDQMVLLEEARDCTERIAAATGKPVFLSRGDRGALVRVGDTLHEISAIQIIKPVDPVGAGDTSVSAIAAALAAGADPLEAAELANFASAVTVQKLKTTGTATPEEILAIGTDPDYVYHPELADDPRRARYLDDTEIEVVHDLPGRIAIRHAIFDHDGTLSTLRQGWERIMEPMMIRAILGPRYDTADEALYHKVVDTVRAFIDKTTGMQTLVQMQGLVDLTRQFGCVNEADILDMHGYKSLYNEQLLAMVRHRIKKLGRGELDASDFQIKNARPMLEMLHARGVKLYLASGTDQADVAGEAEGMGYAHLFEGRIFGAVGDIKVEAKKLVIERIIREHGLSGPQFAVFGDGPVEIRESRKRGGIAVGVASDELRRFGLNAAKRTRLIRAGADIIIPDFSQIDLLARLLQFK